MHQEHSGQIQRPPVSTAKLRHGSLNHCQSTLYFNRIPRFFSHLNFACGYGELRVRNIPQLRVPGVPGENCETVSNETVFNPKAAWGTVCPANSGRATFRRRCSPGLQPPERAGSRYCHYFFFPPKTERSTALAMASYPALLG